ncbi:YqzE family protein [Niallia sp.]|uniref:YqzE family protein n=1 Tax=Niallia sp. TaxID=2837523 RepID=UPI00289BB820|nr:YqzE family protein [Niallia sp.]
MNTNDYVKYLTQTFVQYMDQPKEQRQKLKEEKKGLKEPFMLRWFGILPYLIMFSLKGRKYKR